MPPDDAERIHPASRDEWRAWLAEHHTRGNGVWVVTWRTGSGHVPLDYEDQVLEALAHGWIDSTRRVIDDERAMTWFAPRRSGSTWVRSNKQRVARLEAEGRMEPAGRAKVEEARASGMWTLLDDAEDGVEPPDLVEALDADPAARATWTALPPGVRKTVLVEVALARRPSTRRRRIEKAVAACARGDRPA